MRIGSHLVPKL